jgi:acetoin utilization protein AcuB
MRHYQVKDWMTSEPITADPKMRMIDAHKLMRANKIRRLPVVGRNNKIVGVVTRSDIRRAEASDATTLNVWELHYLLAHIKVSEIMTKDVITVHAEDTLKKAAALLNDHKIGALPVVDEAGHVVGILTESDIFRVLIEWLNGDD